MKRYCILVGVTILLGAFVLLSVKFGLGWKSLPSKKEEVPLRNPILRAKFMTLVSLQIIGKQRPYTEQEMSLLRKSISDPDGVIRSMAIAALERATHNPKQREEAIKLILPYLKDPEWLVRSHAVTAMARLEVKEAIPHILPLLNDPKPEVREDARKVLKRLGYK